MDGEELTSEIPPGVDMAAVFKILDERSSGDQRFLKGISFDGETLPTGDLAVEEWTVDMLSRVSEVRMFSISVRELAAETVDGFVDYLRRAPDGVLALVDDFRRGNEQEAFKRNVEVLSALDELFKLLGSLRGICEFDLLALEVGGQTVAETMRDFQVIMEEMNTSLEEVNVFMVTDLLEFEIVPKLEQFKKILEAVRATLVQG